jgi:hypothetical protein
MRNRKPKSNIAVNRGNASGSSVSVGLDLGRIKNGSNDPFIEMFLTLEDMYTCPRKR